MCSSRDEIQEKTVPLKGHLCTQRTSRKGWGKEKSGGEHNVGALHTALPVHQGQNGAILQRAPLAQMGRLLSLGSKLSPSGLHSWPNLQAQITTRCRAAFSACTQASPPLLLWATLECLKKNPAGRINSSPQWSSKQLSHMKLQRKERRIILHLRL